MILKKLCIEKFRGIINLEIEFGGKITFIAGRNGTYKTTILGLIASAFNFSGHKSILKENFTFKLKDLVHLLSKDIKEEKDSIKNDNVKIKIFLNDPSLLYVRCRGVIHKKDKKGIKYKVERNRIKSDQIFKENPQKKVIQLINSQYYFYL